MEKNTRRVEPKTEKRRVAVKDSLIKARASLTMARWPCRNPCGRATALLQVSPMSFAHVLDGGPAADHALDRLDAFRSASSRRAFGGRKRLDDAISSSSFSAEFQCARPVRKASIEIAALLHHLLQQARESRRRRPGVPSRCRCRGPRCRGPSGGQDQAAGSTWRHLLVRRRMAAFRASLRLGRAASIDLDPSFLPNAGRRPPLVYISMANPALAHHILKYPDRLSPAPLPLTLAALFMSRQLRQRYREKSIGLLGRNAECDMKPVWESAPRPHGAGGFPNAAPWQNASSLSNPDFWSLNQVRHAHRPPAPMRPTPRVANRPPNASDAWRLRTEACSGDGGVGAPGERRGRRGLLQHLDDRLPGDHDRSLLCRPDHHLHLPAHRQRRRQPRGHRDHHDRRPRGLVLRADITEPANWRAAQHLDAWLKSHDLVGIAGVDTRPLTRRIRDGGAPIGLLIHAPDRPFDVDALLFMAKAAAGRAWKAWTWRRR